MGERSVFDYARIAARAEERLLKLLDKPGCAPAVCSAPNRQGRGRAPRGRGKCSG